tara:strand:- start:49 stop:249 length:201 start_codon:yes stop_codon:yes gene_type:complete
MNLEEAIKKTFKSYSNKRLVERINYRFNNDLNDDDEIYELCRRQKVSGKTIAKVVGNEFVIIKENK